MEIHNLSHSLARELDIKTLGQLKYFLEIKVAPYFRGIFISQCKYLTDLLKDTVKSEETSVDHQTYQRFIGQLLSMTHTQPDISYAVGILSQFMHQPKESYLHAAYQVEIEMFTNVDYTRSMIDQRSISGHLIFIGRNIVTQRSKKQKVAACSSAEAKFRAFAQDVCELLWMKNLLDELKISLTNPMKHYYENKSAINIHLRHSTTKDYSQVENR
ncbi:unnamed protein product [Spirodela intermedia]|uniref:Uncharacterized protein n=1 Tax=Spirodela intermedia TaxID=51605 RepID=A0A7I8KLZ6_SPIIN|nr:unnamed protein product [Spirodela intermedia]